jgi:uncharacterized protein with FMN-binding domain
MWWQTHPFSLSAPPTDGKLRFTVKDRGDASATLATLRRGAPVALEGPYGVCTPDVFDGRRALFIAGGIGIAPVRAVLETLGPDSQPVVLYRAHHEHDLVYLKELEDLAGARRGRVLTLVGPSSPLRRPRSVRSVVTAAGRPRWRSGSPSSPGRAPAAHARAGLRATGMPSSGSTSNGRGGDADVLLPTSFARPAPPPRARPHRRERHADRAARPSERHDEPRRRVSGQHCVRRGHHRTPASPPGDRQPPAFSVPTTAPTARSASCTGATKDGPAVDTRWGPVQVAVTVASDGRLCDVEALEYPNDNRRSASINQRALPVLHTRVLSQGANFNAVSGATVTSEGYRASLQAVLDH